MNILLFTSIFHASRAKSPEYQGLGQLSEYLLLNSLCLYTLDSSGKLESLFIKAGMDPRVNSIKYNLIDCIKFHEFCSDRKIYLFPSVYYHGYDKMHEFTWDYTLEDFISFGVKMSGNSTVQIMSEEHLELFQKTHDCSFTLYYSSSDTLLSSFNYVKIFNEIADHYKDTYIHFAVSEYIDEDYSTLPFIKQTGIDRAYGFKLTLPFSPRDIFDFIKVHRLLLCMEVTYSNWSQLLKTFKNKVIGIGFVDKGNSGHMEYIERFKIPLWQLYASQVSDFGVVYVDKSLYPDIVKKFKVFNSFSLVIVDYRTMQSYYLGHNKFKDPYEVIEVMMDVWDHIDITEHIHPKPPAMEIKLSYVMPVLSIAFILIY